MFGCLAVVFLIGGCGRIDHLGKPPSFSPSEGSHERRAMNAPPITNSYSPKRDIDHASLWSAGQRSLLGDRRAVKQGDILTVVIEIDEEAAISNSTDRSRTASERLSVPDLLSIPQRIDPRLPEGASSAEAVNIDSSASSGGNGSVSRQEELTLRIAAAVTQVLPNGVLEIRGSQEVRVNFELRELLVQGFVRPEDISRRNEITYDKIASARISYGGRGQISDMQQPRYGQQVLDMILPF
ncbi:flagellar basal body L-ring protein FlgH [Roseovarius phycicola]|uniref:flagellar basal body L-ring protein FlgH n=1 Tax=Roseovarius phycicola TaxID=3080976 RepID=UPI003BAEE845